MIILLKEVTSMLKCLGIYCAGGFGGVTFSIAKRINKDQALWNKIVFIDDSTDAWSELTEVVDYCVFKQMFPKSETEIVIAAGEPNVREKLYDKVKKDGYKLANLIHPQAYAQNISKIGEGNIICAFAYVSESNVSIGDNIILMPYAQISHDNTVGNHCVIASSVNLSGTTTLKDRSYIGVGAKLREGITVGEDAIVGMGAIVTKSVSDHSVVAGIPAKAIRENTGHVFGEH